jgi:hypothetical protein
MSKKQGLTAELATIFVRQPRRHNPDVKHSGWAWERAKTGRSFMGNHAIHPNIFKLLKGYDSVTMDDGSKIVFPTKKAAKKAFMKAVKKYIKQQSKAYLK